MLENVSLKSMRFLGKLPVLWLGLALVPPAALGSETLPIEWGDSHRFESERRLTSGQVLRVCGPLQKGQAVHWTFHADAVLAFDIHHLVGKRVHYGEKRLRTKGLQGRFVAPETVAYCWRWTNRSAAPVRMAFMLRH